MRFFLLLVLVLMLTSSTCDKGSSAVPRTSLNMVVRHHDQPLAGIDVRVFHNYMDRPDIDQIEDFDRNQLSKSGGEVVFRDLPLGTHWFIGIGYDPTIGEQVIGHLPIRFDRRMLRHDTILFVGEEDFYRID